eukprot:CAMPEP_0169411896 /NCGR_PEP_ID=MMETSP1017-20121227/60539_1 /TAXON_ID=342587 /ORGANISM="Karlodinium micrum, Strain CCMP2283" /LENGTH=148 /DNA_ID=CAMNT_0009519219 /DNA_START=74 /DNA_END=517 /DNA_ORIENTATION=-
MGLERALGHLVFWVWVGVREADSSAAAGDVSENRCVLGESETQVASTPGTALLQQNFARRAPHLSETLREELQESEREGDIAIVALQDSAHRKASKTDHGLIISFFQWLNKSMLLSCETFTWCCNSASGRRRERRLTCMARSSVYLRF